jgi:hypothetical protein
MFMRRIVCAVFYFLLELVHQPMILTAVIGPARCDVSSGPTPNHYFSQQAVSSL